MKRISAETKFSIRKWIIENKESTELWAEVFNTSKSSVYKIFKDYRLNRVQI